MALCIMLALSIWITKIFVILFTVLLMTSSYQVLWIVAAMVVYVLSIYQKSINEPIASHSSKHLFMFKIIDSW